MADLDHAATVRWSTEPRGYPLAGVEHSITLDRQAACAPDHVGELPVYTETLREFGRALDFAGGGVARRQAQKALIAQYMS
ncbi:hypothetical protein, partial [Nocardia cerradoensis]|uniref:hypothetical protein n=1 Tax=Nocardia cerradoensis TaxID=85688 RepID=UPI00117E649B